MFRWLMASDPIKSAAAALYGRIVAQSRLPEFFKDMGVPDTVTGRFETIVLHLFLVLSRLKSFGRESARLSQALSEAFVADMDAAMREMGVGDLTVPKKMQAAAGAYFGRLKAYELALEGKDQDLEAAIARNVFADDFIGDGDGTPAPAPSKQALAALADYMRSNAKTLGEAALDDFMNGRIEFAPLVGTAPRPIAGDLS